MMFSQSASAVKKDMELDQAPEDSISKVAFAPNSNYLVASSWDNNVSIPPEQGEAKKKKKGKNLFNAHQ